MSDGDDGASIASMYEGEYDDKFLKIENWV